MLTMSDKKNLWPKADWKEVIWKRSPHLITTSMAAIMFRKSLEYAKDNSRADTELQNSHVCFFHISKGNTDSRVFEAWTQEANSEKQEVGILSLKPVWLNLLDMDKSFCWTAMRSNEKIVFRFSHYFSLQRFSSVRSPFQKPALDIHLEYTAIVTRHINPSWEST